MTAYMRMHLPIPADLLFLWQVLHDAGHEVLFVGGCVRDMIIGEPVHDYDLASSATPSEVMSLFPECIPTGIQHGTVTVIHHGRAVEVTTFRTEDKYQDNRRPDTVVFVGRVDEDLQRRDFTCNSMAYRPDLGLIDLFDGLGDLNRRCLRTVGSASARFSEDALRMLRAVRFCAQLDLDPEQSLLIAAQIHQDRICSLSRERIASELSRLFTTRFPDRLNAFTGIGIISTALSALDRTIAREEDLVDLYQQLLPAQANRAGLPPELFIPAGLLAVLLCEKSGPEAADVLQPARQQHYIRSLRLDLIHNARFSSTVASDSTALLMACASILDVTEMPMQVRVRNTAARIRTACLLTPDEARARVVHACSLLKLMQEARPPMRWPGLCTDQPSCLDAWNAALAMQANRDIIAITELPVNGKDLIRLGAQPGRALGHILEGLLQKVIRSPRQLTREQLFAAARERLDFTVDFTNDI